MTVESDAAAPELNAVNAVGNVRIFPDKTVFAVGENITGMARAYTATVGIPDPIHVTLTRPGGATETQVTDANYRYSFSTAASAPGDVGTYTLYGEDRERTGFTPGEATVVGLKIVVHPIDGDFDPQKIGRVLISAKHGGGYYTTAPTTRANLPAQRDTNQGNVTITAHLTPSADANGVTVYFRMVDPDDLSPYETDTLPDDNLPGGGGLGNSNAVATNKNANGQPLIINGKSVAAAEVDLGTGSASGNNYQIEASLDPNFTFIAGRSAVLVAWKRCYLEIDKMYQKGASLREAFTPTVGTEPDVLKVDNADDFDVDNLLTPLVNEGEVVLFFRDTAAVTTEVLKKTVTLNHTDDTIEVRRIPPGTTTLPLPLGDVVPLTFPQYSGVRLTNDSSTVPDPSTDFLVKAFGSATDGSDGGAFVEFRDDIKLGWTAPKYSSFPDRFVAIDFCARWFKYQANNNNVFQLLTSLHAIGISGVADPRVNTSTVNTTVFNNATANAEIAVHEVGHQFDLYGPESFTGQLATNPHVDQYVNAENHEHNGEHCIMSYNNNMSNSKTEFDWTPTTGRNDCMYLVRTRSDPK